MAKYSYEIKQKAVMSYIKGEGSYNYVSKQNGITNECVLKKWVNAYREFGDDGLMRSRKNKNYTFEFKLSVVELYLTTEISYQELALKVGMNNPPLITKWVNDFRIAGPDALREKSKGRKPIMPKQKKIDNTNENEKYLKQLQDENLKLRIENAYLKELRRLRLEKEAQKKKQELSATSEDCSN
ncbi:MAG: helix-turn-helix domain-containing protein [Oscillospiraceae bacterium]